MSFSLKDSLHQGDLSQRQQLLLVLGSEGGGPLPVARIKDVAIAAGLRLAKKWDVGTILGLAQ